MPMRHSRHPKFTVKATMTGERCCEYLHDYIPAVVVHSRGAATWCLCKTARVAKGATSPLQQRTSRTSVRIYLSRGSCNPKKICVSALLRSGTIHHRIIHMWSRTLGFHPISARCTRILRGCMHPEEVMDLRQSQLRWQKCSIWTGGSMRARWSS